MKQAQRHQCGTPVGRRPSGRRCPRRRSRRAARRSRRRGTRRCRAARTPSPAACLVRIRARAWALGRATPIADISTNSAAATGTRPTSPKTPVDISSSAVAARPTTSEADAEHLVQADPADQQLAVDLADDDQPDGVEAEQQAEGLRGGAVDLLDDERRGRDVGEQRGEGEAAGEHVAGEDAVGEQVAHGAQGLADAAAVPLRGRQGLGQPRPDQSGEQRSPMTVRTTNTPRQSVTRRIWPPISGATIGATPEISMRVEKKRAMATPSYRSRTTARAMTMPGRAREALSQPEGDQEFDGRRERAQTRWRRRRRRARRAAGRGGPTGRSSARPRAARAPCRARQAVRVSWTVAAGACRAPVTSGRAGRYMSIASGGVAVRPPRRRVTSRPVRRTARTVGLPRPGPATCLLASCAVYDAPHARACGPSLSELDPPPMLSARTECRGVT